jgi:hypothetical protein
MKNIFESLTELIFLPALKIAAIKSVGKYLRVEKI